MPVVSIITPCLNGMPYLKQMLTSVQKQSMPEWQLICIDDGSTDGSLEFMEEAAQNDSRILILRSTGRCGTATVRNLGLDAATGDYVAFLDCDDWWHPDKLKRQLFALKSQRAVFACCTYQVCSSDGRHIRTQEARLPPTRDRHLRKSLTIGLLTGIFERRYFLELRFKAYLLKAEDYVFWSDLLLAAERQGLKCISIDLPLAYYRTHNSGKSTNKRLHAIAHWNIFRKEFQLPLLRAAFIFGFYAINGIRCRLFRTLRPDLPLLSHIVVKNTNVVTPYAAPRFVFQVFLWILRRLVHQVRQIVSRSRDTRLSLPPGFAYDPNDHIGSKLTESGLYEYPELQTITWLGERFGWNDGYLVDVGAHIGVHTCALARSFAKVVAFEPNPKNYQLLRHNSYGLANVTCYQVALTTNPGFSGLTVSADNSGHSTLVALHDSAQVHGIIVDCSSLDKYDAEFDLPLRFIKIDVEGHESLVMQGASSTIDRHRPIIGFELLSDSGSETASWWRSWLDTNRYVLFELRHKDAGRLRIITALRRLFVKPELVLRKLDVVPFTTHRMLFAIPVEHVEDFM